MSMTLRCFSSSNLSCTIALQLAHPTPSRPALTSVARHTLKEKLTKAFASLPLSSKAVGGKNGRSAERHSGQSKRSVKREGRKREGHVSVWIRCGFAGSYVCGCVCVGGLLVVVSLCGCLHLRVSLSHTCLCLCLCVSMSCKRVSTCIHNTQDSAARQRASHRDDPDRRRDATDPHPKRTCNLWERGKFAAAHFQHSLGITLRLC